MNDDPRRKTVDKVARDQAGLVTRAQVMAAGFTNKEWQALLREGWLVSLRRGLYRRLSPSRWYERELHAALLLAGEGSVISHRSAQLLHQLWGLDRAARPREVTVPFSRRVIVDGVNIYRANLGDADAEEMRGLRVTTKARTLLDLASVLEGEGLAVAFESARREPRFLEELAERLKKSEPIGADELRALIADARRRPRPFDSAFEVMVWRRLKFSGLPLPIPQYEIKTGRKTYYADFAWPEQKVVLELEGHETHGLDGVFHKDKRRAAAIAAEGYLYFPLTVERYRTDFVGYLKEVATALKRPTGKIRSAA